MPTDALTRRRVDKVVYLVATSTKSWEAAAQTAVTEAAKSIRDLDVAQVVQKDLTATGEQLLYRIKLQVTFRLDRNRIDSAGMPLRVTRYLVVANQTLASAGLGQLIGEKTARGPAEFHVVVPQPVEPMVHADPSTGLVTAATASVAQQTRQAAREQAGSRLTTFRESYGELGDDLTCEVILADPLTAAHTVLARAAFDEIIISTLPAGVSRWLKLDLPSRIERAFNLPVTTLIQHDSPST